MADTDPDVIRGIERVTGEVYDPDTGEWHQPDPELKPCRECGRWPHLWTCPAQDS